MALERPTTEQPALQAMLTSAKLPEAEKEVLRQPGWQASPDGRSSKAMLQLMVFPYENYADAIPACRSMQSMDPPIPPPQGHGMKLSGSLSWHSKQKMQGP